MTHFFYVYIVVCFAIITVDGSSAYADWPDWRGPTADGRSDAMGLPLTWSETENIAWKTPVHDLGHSTPVVWNDQVWITTAKEDGSVLYAVCVNLVDGAILHDIEMFHPQHPQRIHVQNTYATPSPVVEEGRAYVHFGTFGTAAIDSNTGEILWRRSDLNCDHLQGPVSSPVLFEDLIILHLEGTDNQFIAALDKTTGETVWYSERPREIYEDLEPFYYRKSYTTPVVLEIDGEQQLVSNGAQIVTGHNPRTGEEIWRLFYGDDSTISRIVSGHGFLFVNRGGPPTPRGPQLWAIRAGGSGELDESQVIWKLEEDAPLESSPVLVGDLLYTLSDRGVLKCLEAKTGEEVWSERLPGRYGASLLYADGRIHAFSMQGLTTIFEPGRQYKSLAVNQLTGGFWASPAVADTSILLRTKTHLYRVAE